MNTSYKYLKLICAVFSAAMLSISLSQAATNNTGNSPGFILIDICSNGIGDGENSFDIPRMEPNVFDIGLDLGADGDVDLWLSNENAEYLGRGNSDAIGIGSWRRLHFFQLDQYVGQTLSLHIVDQSEAYYLAINAIRVNAADGNVVENAIANGFFEDGLIGWNVKSTNISDPSSMVINDSAGDYVQYSGKFLSTMTNPESGDFTQKATLVSDPFVLPQVTSFIYGNVSGGASEFVNIEGALGSDNKSGVYIDLGTSNEAPNGQYDQNVDLPLIGCYGGSAGGARNSFYSVFINTTGLEGRQAQVVGFDDSLEYHIGLDAFRMNWDWEEKIIENGGFDQGIPTPDSDDPNLADWLNDEQGDFLIHSDHPSGSIPGWQVIKKDGGFGEAFWFDTNSRDDHMSGRAWIGTGGGDMSNDGVEIRSDVFSIEPIPSSEESVFVQFASAQGSNRLRYGGDNGEEAAFGRIELIVDTNGDGLYNNDDFIYTQTNQAMAHNMSNSHRDLWHHPEYRWYIKPEHQGLMAMFRAEDRFGPFKASYGWMCVDDLFVWDGHEAQLAFPNSDFEMGTMENWNEVITGGNGFTSWLSGSKKALDASLVTHSAMNNRSTDIDGDFAADTASNQTGGGDSGMGILTSQPFALPNLNKSVNPSYGTVYTYGFDDETLQGWQQVKTSETGPEKLGLMSQNNPEVGDSAPPAPLTSPAFIGPVPFEAQDGDNTRDRAHDTLVLRSPEFPLYANGEISFALVGGSKPGMDLAEINQVGLPESSSGSGSIGVALRKASSGEYLTFNARSSNSGDNWETIVINNDDFGDLIEEGEHYTLDFIDSHSGGWGWAAMDDVVVKSGYPNLISYGFDDETLQGWQQVGTSETGPQKLGLMSQNNPEVGDSAPPAPLTSPAFIGPVPFEAQDGDNTRDRAHDTLVLRSPEFPLYANGEISFALVGGSKPGMDLAEINQVGLPESSSGSGSIGVALRKASSGEYLTFNARSSNSGDNWETIVINNDDLGDLFEEGENYTLDFIDSHSGGWGWAAMDDVTIRPGAPASAAISSVRLQDGSIIIEYTGQLESSANLLGDWSPVDNSSSPYSAVIGLGNMFFRVSEIED